MPSFRYPPTEPEIAALRKRLVKSEADRMRQQIRIIQLTRALTDAGIPVPPTAEEARAITRNTAVHPLQSPPGGNA